MKVECSQCGHLGPAADVRQGDDGVVVVCEECGAANPLDGGAGEGESGGTEDEGAEEAADGEQEAIDAAAIAGAEAAAALSGGSDEESPPDPSEYGSRDLTLEKEQALDRLVPDRGPGLRCPKCAKLQRADAENCERCGLHLDEARQYDDGEAPWEQPPSGKDAEFERAQLLWSAYEESGDPDDLADFVGFVSEHMFYEMAIRRLRFYLVDHPEDAAAHEALGELASGVQSQIVAARAQAEADAEELNRDIKQFKRRVAAIIVILGAVTILIVANLVW